MFYFAVGKPPPRFRWLLFTPLFAREKSTPRTTLLGKKRLSRVSHASHLWPEPEELAVQVVASFNFILRGELCGPKSLSRCPGLTF